jgi:putative MFS transporter
MILGSMFYAGGFVGNSFCSLLADLAGRRVMLLISQTCTVAALILNSYVTNFAEVLIILFVYGVIFGVAMAITQVMVSESVPLQYRGRFIVSIQFIYMLGCVYLIGCFYIFLDSYTVGDWRNML